MVKPEPEVDIRTEDYIILDDTDSDEEEDRDDEDSDDFEYEAGVFDRSEFLVDHHITIRILLSS